MATHGMNKKLWYGNGNGLYPLPDMVRSYGSTLGQVLLVSLATLDDILEEKSHFVCSYRANFYLWFELPNESDDQTQFQGHSQFSSSPRGTDRQTQIVGRKRGAPQFD